MVAWPARVVIELTLLLRDSTDHIADVWRDSEASAAVSQRPCEEGCVWASPLLDHPEFDGDRVTWLSISRSEIERGR